MPLVVQKYGGTSVGDPDRIRNVARRVAASHREGAQVVVCVSAMGGETDALVALADDLGGGAPAPREYDVLVSTGERISMSLLLGWSMITSPFFVPQERTSQSSRTKLPALSRGFPGAWP